MTKCYYNQYDTTQFIRNPISTLELARIVADLERRLTAIARGTG